MREGKCTKRLTIFGGSARYAKRGLYVCDFAEVLTEFVMCSLLRWSSHWRRGNGSPKILYDVWVASRNRALISNTYAQICAPESCC
jgi:hypothetical protein